MDELSFEKTYQDGGLVRLWVSASSGLCGARRGLYEDEAAVRAAAGEVLGYSRLLQGVQRRARALGGRSRPGPLPADPPGGLARARDAGGGHGDQR